MWRRDQCNGQSTKFKESHVLKILSWRAEEKGMPWLLVGIRRSLASLSVSEIRWVCGKLGGPASRHTWWLVSRCESTYAPLSDWSPHATLRVPSERLVSAFVTGLWLVPSEWLVSAWVTGLRMHDWSPLSDWSGRPSDWSPHVSDLHQLNNSQPKA